MLLKLFLRKYKTLYTSINRNSELLLELSATTLSSLAKRECYDNASGDALYNGSIVL